MKHENQISDSTILTSVETQISKRIRETLDRRNQVFVTPTLLTKTLEYDGIKYSKKYFDLVTLILLTWYSDYFQGFEGYIRYEIELYLYKNLLFPELSASLVSKEILITVLLEFSKVNNTNILFGTCLDPNQIERVLKQVKLRFLKPRRPKEIIRRRGYKDKGSMRPQVRWLPSDDWSLTDLQNEKEEKQDLYVQTVTSIVRKVGGRLLSGSQL